MLSEATEDNLIDLGPGSPAVVSPRVSTSPNPPPLGVPPAGASASPARTPASLSTQLAGLGEDCSEPRGHSLWIGRSLALSVCRRLHTHTHCATALFAPHLSTATFLARAHTHTHTYRINHG